MKIVSIKDIDATLLQQFDCGNTPLNVFLSNYALKNDRNNIGRTYILQDQKEIIGYVTLANAQVSYIDIPNQIQKTLPKYPLPAVRIARLAVDLKYQNEGYGKALLTFAFKKILIAAINIGIKLVVVDAKEEAKHFYEHYGFIKIKDSDTYMMPVELLIEALTANK